MTAHRPKLPALACLVVALAVAAAAGRPAEAAVFNPETFTLDNGMQVVVVTNRRAPVVSRNDPANASYGNINCSCS